MINGPELIRNTVMLGAAVALICAHVGKRIEDNFDQMRELRTIRRTLQVFVAFILALAMTGCGMTTVVVPDRNADGAIVGELPERLLTENDCDAFHAIGAPCIAATPEQVAQFPADQIAWTQAHTHEVPMWGCTAFDWGTTAVAIIFYGAVESNPLGVAGTIAYGAIYNDIAKKHAAEGDGSMAKASAAVHCGAGVWNLAQIAKVAL